jgi:DNA-binding transcriptional LysR family regulator
MDLNWLRDFECLVRTLNFTRASDERNITQSAFSRRIKALENWVGSPLVNRATYPVQLTEAGQQFLPVALAVISQLSESRQSIRFLSIIWRRGSRSYSCRSPICIRV